MDLSEPLSGPLSERLEDNDQAQFNSNPIDLNQVHLNDRLNEQ